MLFFFPIISLFSIIFMIFSLSPIAYFPFLSWDCCHVEQAAAAAVGSSQGWWSLSSSHGWCCQHVSAMHHVPSCIFGPMKTDSGLSQMVGTRKFHQLSPNVHHDFPKLGCSSMFYFTNCCPHEPGSPKPKPKKPAAKAGQTCQFGNPADG